MKKFLALLIALCMLLSVCSALADETQALKDARSYINLMYKNKPESTPKDYELVGSVPGDGEIYTVDWTTDSDTIAVVREESGLVKIDVNEDYPREVAYKLTATIKDAAGNAVEISFNRVVPAAISLDAMTDEEVVAVAYTLDDGATLPTPTALHGTIVAIPTAYSDEYKNITVNIQVGGLKDQLIQCYRLSGEGADSLKEGDEIAVAGTIKNYKGTIEFDKGCILIPVSSCDSARVAMFAYALEDGAAMGHESTVTGAISAIPSAYSDEYKNITVNIDVPGLEGYTVQCYRLTGEGAEALKEGDLITVTGTIKNYKGTIEFDKGCTFVPAAKAAVEEAAEALLTAGEGSEEAAVLSFLQALGIDTTGYEEEIAGILDSAKEGASGLAADAKESLEGLAGQVSDGLDSLLGQLGEAAGQVQDGAASGMDDLMSLLGGALGDSGDQAGDGADSGLGGIMSLLEGLFGE